MLISDMKQTENQRVLSSRERMKERYSKKYPERNFNDENEQSAIDDLAWEDIEGMESRLGEYETNSKKLTDLFRNNTKAAQMFLTMSNGGNPIQYFIENFGDEFIDAMESEEGKQAFLESYDKWLKKVADNKKLDDEREANFTESIKALQKFQEEKGLSDEETVALFGKLNGIGSDLVMGIYSPESFLMAYNAMNYEGDVEKARTEGEVAGKNARVEEKLRKGKRPEQMPPSLSGAATGSIKRELGENKPEKIGAWGIPVYKGK